MSGQKRDFPYYSGVEEVEIKRQNVSDVAPGYERSQPRTFEAPSFAADCQVTVEHMLENQAITIQQSSHHRSVSAGWSDRLFYLDRSPDQGT